MMPSLDTLPTFFATTAIFALMPGPAMFYAAARTLAAGRAAGLMASLGIHFGGYVHVLAATTGLSLIFHAVPPLYMTVKLAGAAYLVWLVITLFCNREQATAMMPGAVPKSDRRAFAESITVEVLNPKTAIFFLAFLPQFIEASASYPVWMQFLLLGTMVNIIFSLVDLAVVMAAGAVLARLRRSGTLQRRMQQAGGAILIELGAHMATQRN